MAEKATKRKKTNKLDISNSLTVSTTSDLHNKFTANIKKKTDVHLYSKQLTTIDLAGIQFLIYAKEVAAKKGIELIIECNPSDTVSDLAEKTGFSNLFVM